MEKRGIKLIVSIIFLLGIFFTSCGEKATYTCKECGKVFTSLPYQAGWNACEQVESHDKVSPNFDIFCSCDCCLAFTTKDGYKYECK